MKKYLKRIILGLLVVFIVLNIAVAIILKATNQPLSLFDVYQQSIPKQDQIKAKYQKEYLVNASSDFLMQEHNQCAGFATAYNLKVRSKKTTPLKVYNNLKYKLSNGYVLPQSIKTYLEDKGLQVKMYKGNLKQLKTRLNQGKPIITLIGQGLAWQHYVNVVGYDQNNIYLYDSMLSNTNNHKYNRILSNEKFLSYFNNELPIYHNLYYVVE